MSANSVAGMHLSDDHVVEVIDPATGKHMSTRAPAGSWWCSDVWRQAMPIIRYRTGDLTEGLNLDALSLRANDTAHEAHYRASERHSTHQGDVCRAAPRPECPRPLSSSWEDFNSSSTDRRIKTN